MNTKIGVDMNTTIKNCNYLLKEEHVTSWLKNTGGIRLLDGICENPSRIELAWETLKRSSSVKCVRKPRKKSKTSHFSSSSSSSSKFKFPRFEIISEPDHLTNCQSLIDITVRTNDCQSKRRLSSMKFAFSKAPIYRIRSNIVEIQHDILHNGPVLSMMKNNKKTKRLESVKIIGWVKKHWLVQSFTGKIVKVKFGNKTELESNVMAIVPAKFDDPSDPTSAFSLP